MTGLSDTIAAIATAPGSAGVGIVRVSGPEALRVADAVLRGRQTPSQVGGGRFLYGQFLGADAELIDEGLCLVFRSPHSYTGEHVAELQSHGSPAVLARLLARVLELGARAARPGEFTLRAYLAGRLDLTQAEAVLNLVQAQTEAGRKQAALGLSGALSARIERVSLDVTRTLAAVQAMLDYPEEGVPDEQREVPLGRAADELAALLATARAGQLSTRGARLALLGRPNAGKSSLLNALLGYERSIVTPTPGTTRDYLEAHLELAGVPVTLLDTAGLRETTDETEAAGVRHSRSLGQNADLVLLLEDGALPREPLELPGDVPTILIQTKTDLGSVWHDPQAIGVSALTGDGLSDLRGAVRAALLGDVARSEAWLTTERQADAARRALAHIEAARKLPDDLASLELEDALVALAELTGRDVSEDVIDAVFRNFCVGK
ncbi:tRNA uridine-5-carboxymethylaminomethyl(34) synthesis GTPase MnmE [Deinococcus sp.]|uniref:tRNA uridine-5-carboxymethylaminomethyl(34) synthesis GTPase MnmE n=1 Tax=Deinococcus sp. TaxID=47478 RepID=UPI0025F63B09|nr:tRNA uridine-5-carboxymethylaminomethyl(34) synthesis GTPase MnmE [Deinococcus sp.]